MRKYLLATGLVFCFCLAAHAAEESWEVQEAFGYGHWRVTLSGTQIKGAAIMNYGERETEFIIDGEVKDGAFHINRIDPDQPEPCFYRSDKETEESITGSLTCGETSQSWVVLRRIKLD